ncbi:uncharacterized protein TRAVEDRAFT_51553 [Trametes versicolor FP-101664 SS1]|uniref:uncharacterized protein n=1 Tax=Trametes versicolor (strain FP-101664) TaxID=717944 RepID=UPI0004621E98|nr:uncharacterized protein TRAVEDRAFT_51553 [Trametes versicolor FP-101664 SS1]EIW53810.1 hypothetical protein TRAVEDRAFT_51553 [Trametes versicolor FP-101664 SS1]
MSPVAHNVLYNTDLLSCIFSELVLPVPATKLEEETRLRADGKTLATAARVCKTFSEPALRTLWWSLPDLMPLWRLLGPLDLLTEPNVPAELSSLPGKYVLSGSREVTPEQWARFREYAARVRIVRQDPQFGTSPLHYSVWQLLTYELRGVPFLPRLHTLCWNVTDPYDNTLLMIFPPTAAALAIDFKDPYHDPLDLEEDDDDMAEDVPENWGTPAQQKDAIARLLRTVCTNAPRLTDLTLSRYKHTVPLLRDILPLLPGLRRLDLSATSPVVVATLRALAGMNTLETLTNVPIKNARIDGAFSGFPALKTLSVSGGVQDVVQLLTAIESRLTSLAITSHHSAMDWQAAFPRIEGKLSTLTAFGIHIDSCDTDLPDPDGMIGNNEDVELPEFLAGLNAPLAQVQNLRLSFDNIIMHCNDHKLAQAAQMFPYLTRFELIVRGSWEYPTIASAIAFAQHCPRLETLLLPNPHNNSKDVLAALRPSAPVHTALRVFCVLDMGDIKIAARDVPLLGAVLAAVFPSLDVRACADPPRTWLHHDRDSPWVYPEADVRKLRRKRWKSGLATWKRVLQAVAASRCTEEPQQTNLA